MGIFAGECGTLMRGTRKCVVALCLMAVVGFSGCALLQPPAPSPRIVQVGSVYFRDGQAHREGITGGLALELVRGDPKAEPFAQKARTHRLMGWGGFLAGVVGMGASTTVPNGRLAVSGILLSTAFAVGSLLYFDRQSAVDQQDAINVYNDDLFLGHRTCDARIP